jgi:hypothetical protein
LQCQFVLRQMSICNWTVQSQWAMCRYCLFSCLNAFVWGLSNRRKHLICTLSWLISCIFILHQGHHPYRTPLLECLIGSPSGLVYLQSVSNSSSIQLGHLNPCTSVGSMSIHTCHQSYIIPGWEVW